MKMTQGRELIMPIVSLNQIIELNEILRNKEIRFKIHIRDACGGQNFYIEPLEEGIISDKYEDLYITIEQFFTKNRMTIIYADDKINFTIK